MTKKKKHSSAFSEGDIVRLNIQGAPTMVVYAAEGDQITCDWFDGKSLCRKPFHEKELTAASPSPSTRELARAILSILQEAPGIEDAGLEKIRQASKEASQKGAAPEIACPSPLGGEDVRP